MSYKAVLAWCLIAWSVFGITACVEKRAPRGAVTSVGAVVPVARTLPPLPARPLSAKLQQMRARVSNSTAALRQLDWQQQVGMAELTGWEYGTRTSEMAEVLGGDELRALSRLAVTGGVLPEGTDLAALAASFTAASAGATYSPLDKQVLIVDEFRNDSLLTHEFVHALQDQHFDLLKLLIVRPFNFDRTEAVFALIEGDAMNVQRRTEEGEAAYARHSLDDITRTENERFNEYRKEVGALFPPLLTESFIFRYRDGARFVEAIRRQKGGRGGERAIDELFRRPPVSSEQILHPEKYLANETPREVHVDEPAFAAQKWQLKASTPLGEIGIRGLLMTGVNERDAVRAAAGWGGDCAYLFERSNSAPLFVWKTLWDKTTDADEFFNAYNATLRRHAAAQNAATDSNNKSVRQMIWRDDMGRATLVERFSDAVIIVRGAESDVSSALELAKR